MKNVGSRGLKDNLKMRERRIEYNEIGFKNFNG